MRVGHEVTWSVRPHNFSPEQRKASVAVFFGRKDAQEDNVAELMNRAIPIIPVISKQSMVLHEIPKVLRALNCLDYSNGGMQRVVTAMLESIGLLPRQPSYLSQLPQR